MEKVHQEVDFLQNAFKNFLTNYKQVALPVTKRSSCLGVTIKYAAAEFLPLLNGYCQNRPTASKDDAKPEQTQKAIQASLESLKKILENKK